MMKIINCFFLLFFYYHSYGQNNFEDSTATLQKIKKYEDEFEKITNKVFKIIKVNIDSTETYSESSNRIEITHISVKQNPSSLYKVVNFWYLHEKLFKITTSYQTLDYNNLKGNGRYYFLDNQLIHKEENKIQADIAQLIFLSNIYFKKGEHLLTVIKSDP